MVVKSFAIVPFGWLYLLSDWLSFVLNKIVGYRKKVILQNLHNAFPEKKDGEISVLATTYYNHLADLLLESIKGLTMNKAQLQHRFVYRNPEIFTPLFENGESAILLGSHFGNWEWGVLSFPLSVNHEVLGTYKPLKNRYLDGYLNSLRKQWGLHLTSMSQAGRAVIQQKGKPTIFVLIADQTPADIKNAHWVNFLNQDTPFLHGMDKLARQMGYPVFYFEIERVSQGRYEVFFSPLCEAKEALAEGEVTRRFAAVLEQTIQKNPANWLWSHRRWKRARKKEKVA
ncbi:MAG: lysophospholipid acyltransferase family protein [Saprospiraceae bacterium]|nr:lysophospholipid acyltransferase family protein [Saprospiraceae bacterium]